MDDTQVAVQVVPQVSIQEFLPSNNVPLANALLGIEGAMEKAAMSNVENAGVFLTAAEKRAAVIVEELKLVNGMDLAAVLLRGKLLRQIEQGSLWTIHPGRYGTLQEMARDQGISVSNLSNIRDLCYTIFPWMNEHNMSVPEMWEQIGMSNFRELIPTMKCLITGEVASSASVNASVERLLDDVAATNHASEVTMTDEEVRAQAIENLLENGSQMTNRDLRATIRPERTPSVNMDVFKTPTGSRFIVAEVTEDQWIMLQRRLNGCTDPIEIEVPQVRIARQQALSTPAMRHLQNLIS